MVWDEQVAPAAAAAWVPVPNLGVGSTYRPGGRSTEHVDRLAALGIVGAVEAPAGRSRWAPRIGRKRSAERFRAPRFRAPSALEA